MVHEFRGIAVIPFAVKLYKVPEMSIAGHRISRNHHVGNSCQIQEHLAAAEVDIAVTAAAGKSSESGCLI